MADRSIESILQLKGLKKDFREVILTLEDVIIPEDRLYPTPSMIDNLTYDQECDLRIYGCELIQTSGELLDLPQVAMAMGQVIFQRFYYRKSFVKHNVEIVAMASVLLSSRLEEGPRKTRDVINVFHHIKQVKNKKMIAPMLLDAHYTNLKNQVIKAERRILKEFGFCMHVNHPHKMIFIYLQLIDCERNRQLVQTAWNYMNDSFRTDVFVRFSPETIACACIYLAARKLQISLPNCPPWWLLMGADEAEMQRISKTILSLYNRKKPNLDELEAIVNNLKKQQNDAKLKAKEIKQAIDGTNTSNASPEESNHPSPVIMSGKKDEYQDRPTLTLGEELSRLCKKKAELRVKTSEDQKNDKYSDMPEKTGSRNHSRGERVHDHKLNEKRYSDSEVRKDKYRNDKHSYKSDNIIRSDENEKGRANGLDRLIPEKMEYEYTDKYSHHKEKSKKRRRDRSPSPMSYQDSKVARDGRHKYSYSRTPSPGAYKESRHSRDYKYKHSKHSSRY